MESRDRIVERNYRICGIRWDSEVDVVGTLMFLSFVLVVRWILGLLGHHGKEWNRGESCEESIGEMK